MPSIWFGSTVQPKLFLSFNSLMLGDWESVAVGLEVPSEIETERGPTDEATSA